MFLFRKPGLRYVKRTGVTAWDFSGVDFTPDGTLHTLDMSAILPKNAKLVHCRLQIADGQAGRTFAITGPDETGLYGIYGCGTQVAGIASENDVVVPTNTSGEIKYYLPNEVIDSRVLLVLGWWV